MNASGKGGVASSRGSGLSTLAVRAGSHRDPCTRAVGTPIFQTTTFELTDDVVAAMVDGTVRNHLIYTRYGNPTQRACGSKIAALEGGESGLVMSSGMAAITATMAALVGPGEHVVSARDLYGGTHALFQKELPRMGMAITMVDAVRLDQVASAIRPETRVVYVESISNPLVRVADIAALSEIAHGSEAALVVDATFATPINQRPLSLGADVVIHSGSKYLNGHSDVIAGAVVSTDATIAAIWERMLRFGGSLDPHASYLFERGLKTLAVRIAKHNESALRVAEWLSGHSRVVNVHYPGLASHPQHVLAARLLSGFGGIVSFELEGGDEASDAVLKRLRLITVATSLGGVESLISLPHNTSHASLSAQERTQVGIAPGLTRLSVGIEDSADIIADLDQALAVA